MSQSRFDDRQALTLLELVVVLGILAVLSTVAVRSLEPVADQARFESSQRLLDDLRSSLISVSDRYASSNSILASGYIVDTGDLPANLNSLLQRPVGLIDRTVQTFDSDRDLIDDVRLVSGWNGPYLQLAAGTSDITDGWGSAITVGIVSGVVTLGSGGSDGDSIAPEDGYRADLLVSISQQDYEGAAIFRLFEIDNLSGSRIDPNPTGTQRLAVLFYGVNAAGGSTGAIAEQFAVVTGSTGFEFLRDNALVGPIAARAILWDDVNGNSSLEVGENIVKKSFVHYSNILPKSESRIEMELR